MSNDMQHEAAPSGETSVQSLVELQCLNYSFFLEGLGFMPTVVTVK